MSQYEPLANSLAIPDPTVSLQRPLLLMYSLVPILDDRSGLPELTQGMCSPFSSGFPVANSKLPLLRPQVAKC